MILVIYQGFGPESASSATPPSIPKAEAFDMRGVAKLYEDGELDQVVQILEPSLRTKPSRLSTEERIFAYKHLGVIYSSTPENQSKGEAYFFQLLKLVPTVELADMYVSEKIEAVFRQVKEDFQRRNQYAASHDRFGRPLTKPDTTALNLSARTSQSSEKSMLKRKSQAWKWWALGGLTAAGIGAAYILAAPEEKKPRTFEAPE